MNTMNTKNWTIGSRIILGFTLITVVSLVLGGFSLVRFAGMRAALVDVTDNTVPSLVVLGEIGSVSRERTIARLKMLTAIDEEKTAMRQSVDEATKKMEGLFTKYESLIADPEERRLFEEIKRAQEAVKVTSARIDALERESNFEESERLLREVQFANYDKLSQAVDNDYNHNLPWPPFFPTGDANTVAVSLVASLCSLPFLSHSLSLASLLSCFLFFHL